MWIVGGLLLVGILALIALIMLLRAEIGDHRAHAGHSHEMASALQSTGQEPAAEQVPEEAGTRANEAFYNAETQAVEQIPDREVEETPELTRTQISELLNQLQALHQQSVEQLQFLRQQSEEMEHRLALLDEVIERMGRSAPSLVEIHAQQRDLHAS